jgi:outer membrane receptor protein involved in Fe transport
MPTVLTRRHVLIAGSHIVCASALFAAMGGVALLVPSKSRAAVAQLGVLLPADNNGIRLPEGLTQRFASFTQLDLMADWSFTENVSFALGAENVLDEYPDEAVFQASRGLIYSRNAPYGTDGGRYYVRLNVKY